MVWSNHVLSLSLSLWTMSDAARCCTGFTLTYVCHIALICHSFIIANDTGKLILQYVMWLYCNFKAILVYIIITWIAFPCTLALAITTGFVNNPSEKYCTWFWNISSSELYILYSIFICRLSTVPGQKCDTLFCNEVFLALFVEFSGFSNATWWSNLCKCDAWLTWHDCNPIIIASVWIPEVLQITTQFRWNQLSLHFPQPTAVIWKSFSFMYCVEYLNWFLHLLF